MSLEPQPKITSFEPSLYEFKKYLDTQLDNLRGRLAEYEKSEFDRHVRDLQGTINAGIKTANERFQADMEKSKSIKNASLRERNEKFLHESLILQIDTLKKILDDFISRYNK
jgi:hypothetical protein